MAYSNERELFHRLQSLGVLGDRALGYRRILREPGLFEYIQAILMEHGITRDDLEGDLDDDDETLFRVKQAVQLAIMQAAEEGRSPQNEIIPAVSTLGSIRDLSNHLLYSAQAKNMQARWAKDYYHGYFAKRKAQIERALAEGLTAASTGQGGYNNEGGASYYRIVNTCSDIGDCWRRLPQELDEAASKEGVAQAFYDAYDKALDEYWALLGKFADGLSQKDVAYWVGAVFRTLLNTHRKYFRASNSKVLTTVQPLGEEKVKKVEEWIARTDTKFAAALKAAGA